MCNYSEWWALLPCSKSFWVPAMPDGQPRTEWWLHYHPCWRARPIWRARSKFARSPSASCSPGCGRKRSPRCPWTTSAWPEDWRRSRCIPAQGLRRRPQWSRSGWRRLQLSGWQLCLAVLKTKIKIVISIHLCCPKWMIKLKLNCVYDTTYPPSFDFVCSAYCILNDIWIISKLNKTISTKNVLWNKA